MKTQTEEMLLLLDILEKALRQVGWWGEKSPSTEALASKEPFCVDTLLFTEWLQWVYIPKMGAFVAVNQSLPAASNLLAIAEEAWKGKIEETQGLLDVIEALDAMVNHGKIEPKLWAEISAWYL